MPDKPAMPDKPEAARLDAFRAGVLARGRELYRDLPWRRDFDPYGIWVSEVMLQQTQVARVEGRWQRWMALFPTVDALAAASPADVLAEWQGMGYNRRAIALLKAAQVVSSAGGELPCDDVALRALPGIGPATAAGIQAFAFDLPSVYLETNVRSVFLHELFPDAEDVPDSALVPLVEATCPSDAHDPADDPRTWYYALLDYGAFLKRAVGNPSRRSRGHATQSRFEGSRRQKRAEVVRILLAAPDAGRGMGEGEVLAALNEREGQAGRPPVDVETVTGILEELAREGLCSRENGLWRV
ncbi:MAG: adenine glycosylase [Atopobiaceae bacterium]|nr:adenine glycosylase [Atopobiaceae bacterium]MCH4120208.1 adenine glycosylase [Atopobiaceae bacterium]MCI1389757.1 adenine glycosylase [Atopobiaceae bacterium]MCI1432485.1 adenine glycosylase [Atopobiaceae bacterium]MCI1471178.1 adenine glycosylase [Atopobiaceae bacterium]